MVSSVRAGIVSIVKIVKNHELLYEDNRDPFTAGVVSTLASVEVSCTITATSIPFFRPLIRRITGKDSSYHSGGGVVSKQQEAGNGVSVLEVGTGQQGPNYFGR